MDFRTNRLFKNFRWIYSSKKCNLCNFPFSSDRSYSYKAKHISNCPSMWMFGIFPVGSFLLKMWTNTFTFMLGQSNMQNEFLHAISGWNRLSGKKNYNEIHLIFESHVQTLLFRMFSTKNISICFFKRHICKHLQCLERKKIPKAKRESGG